jgi:hypothetical protein
MFDNGLPSLRDADQWRYALVGGLASLPFTTLSYWQTGSELSLNALVFGGILAGYLTVRADCTPTGVGAKVGVIGGLPVLWVVFDIVAATAGLAGPAWFLTSATLLTGGFVIGVGALGFGLAALVGELGSRIGAWLASNRPGDSRGGAEC